MASRGHMVWRVVFIFVYYLSAMSKKLEDDGKTATTTLPLPQHTIKTKKAPVTSQTRLVGRHMQILP